MTKKEEYTRLLVRQLRSSFKEPITDPELLQFISLVNAAYKHYDSTRELMERSMDISTLELQHKNMELTKINQTLDDFNHSVSHDLKTHTINVISLVKMLKKYSSTDNKEKVNDIISRLEMAGTQLNKVIYGFLEISKLEHVLEPIKENLNLSGFIEELKDEFSQIIEKKKAILEFSLNGIENIYASKAHLNVILRNLISNGLKYAKPNQQAVVKVIFNDHGDLYHIEVIDNGIGIDLKKNRLRLFSMFTRLEKHEDVEGTGIGLFLVKRLVDKNGGTITMESEPGEGSKVILEFKKQK